MQIKFSHNYPKLHNQKSARLLSVEVYDRSYFVDKFIEYDTVYDGGHYPLPEGLYIVLVFLGNDLTPFTTVRQYTEDKIQRCHSNIGNIFNIIYTSEEYSSTITGGSTDPILCNHKNYVHGESSEGEICFGCGKLI